MKIKLVFIALCICLFYKVSAQKITLETLIQIDKKNSEEICVLLKSTAPFKWQFQSSIGDSAYNKSNKDKWSYNWSYRTSISKIVAGNDSGCVILETYNPAIMESVGKNIKQFKMKEIEQGYYQGQNYIIIVNESISGLGMNWTFTLVGKELFYKSVNR